MGGNFGAFYHQAARGVRMQQDNDDPIRTISKNKKLIALMLFAAALTIAILKIFSDLAFGN